MKTFIRAAGMAVGASAALLPRNDGCCFQLTASGGASGTLGQLDDGQNRVGGGLGEATYCVNNGMITDMSGRGCILTAPTTQFQCDMGASPDGGFSVGSNGNLQHDGDSTFWACPADQGEYNVYTEKVDGQSKCEKVTLDTGGKCAEGPSSFSAPAKPSKTSQGQTCPPQQTITKTETKVNENTDYKTKTEYKPTVFYKTETQTEQNTQYKPTTVYKTKTEQNTKVVATTVYSTKTVEETETATKSTTVYATKTEQETVTANQPTTVYQTKTIEETETATKPMTQYVTKTHQQTVTAEKPTTVYQTKTVEETETAKKPVTKYQTKYETKYETKQAPAQTVTKKEQYCPSSQASGKPSKTMATQTKPAPTYESSACPTDLNGNYEYPHLIVPVSSKHPAQSYGTSYNGQINGSTSSLFNFDIPQSYKGQTCSLVFLFPSKSDLETSDFIFNGKGSISVDHLSSTAKQTTTWNSVPKVADHAGDFSPQPGNSYVISTGDCAAGTTQSYELSAGGDLALEYFQDYNPSPIGLYITTC